MAELIKSIFVRPMQRCLVITFAVLVVAPVAHAIPSKVLKEQARERGKLEVALKALPSVCQTEDASCKEKRQQVAAALCDYIRGIQANIDFCERYARDADPDEQRETMKAIKDHQADLHWAQQAQKAVAETPSEFTVGTTYDILRSVELHDGPGEKYDKKLNQVASDSSRQIEYLSVDSSTTVKVLDLKGDWAEVQVVEPTFFADTHRGWIPASALKSGKATHKRDGWITHTCFVYAQKDAKSKRIGYLSQGAAVNVVDDESGWLELPAWGVNPVQSSENNKFLLSEGLMKRALYLEASNFTQTPPAPR